MKFFMKREGAYRLGAIKLSLIAFIFLFILVMVPGVVSSLPSEAISDADLEASALAVPGVSVDFSKSVGVVRPDFYGVNTHGSWLGGETRIDANGDGIAETASDLAWHRKAFLDSGMKYMRWDASLGSYYSAYDWSNLGFENWTNSNVGAFSSTVNTGAVGWMVAPSGGASGRISRSSKAHSGNYSLNLTVGKSSHAYVYRNALLNEGKIYNFSVWIKGNVSGAVLYD